MEKHVVNASSTTKAMTFRSGSRRPNGAAVIVIDFSRPSLPDSCENNIRYRLTWSQR
jgi:hypothetical protein